MKRGYLVIGILCVGVYLILGCKENKGFTLEEEAIIHEQNGGIMRLFTIDNSTDSLLLRKKASQIKLSTIDKDLLSLLKNGMLSTVTDTTNLGVGIAAPQVGVSKALIAVQRFDKEGEPFEFYINPEIIYYSEDKSLGWEGCLSIPEDRGQVYRSDTITIRYLNEEQDKVVNETVAGFTAVIFQHEIDHLNGVLFIDKREKEE